MSKTRLELRESIRRNLRAAEQMPATMDGTVTISANSATITGTGTQFLDQYQPFAEIKVESEIRVIRTISSNTSMTVTRVFASAHSGVAHSRVNDRIWTDDEIDEAINDQLYDLGDVLATACPRILQKSATANLVANTDTVTIPTSLRNLELVEVLPESGATVYRPLVRVTLRNKDLDGIYWWLPGSSVAKPQAVPSGYCIVSPTTIELNSKPPASITAGLKFWGPGRLTAFTADTETLADTNGGSANALPDAESFDKVIEDWATSDLWPRDEAQSFKNANFYQERGNSRLARILTLWTQGRADGSAQVAIVQPYF